MSADENLGGNSRLPEEAQPEDTELQPVEPEMPQTKLQSGVGLNAEDAAAVEAGQPGILEGAFANAEDVPADESIPAAIPVDEALSIFDETPEANITQSLPTAQADEVGGFSGGPAMGKALANISNAADGEGSAQDMIFDETDLSPTAEADAREQLDLARDGDSPSAIIPPVGTQTNLNDIVEEVASFANIMMPDSGKQYAGHEVVDGKIIVKYKNISGEDGIVLPALQDTGIEMPEGYSQSDIEYRLAEDDVDSTAETVVHREAPYSRRAPFEDDEEIEDAEAMDDEEVVENIGERLRRHRVSPSNTGNGPSASDADNNKDESDAAQASGSEDDIRRTYNNRRRANIPVVPKGPGKIKRAAGYIGKHKGCAIALATAVAIGVGIGYVAFRDTDGIETVQFQYNSQSVASFKNANGEFAIPSMLEGMLIGNEARDYNLLTVMPEISIGTVEEGNIHALAALKNAKLPEVYAKAFDEGKKQYANGLQVIIQEVVKDGKIEVRARPVLYRGVD